MCRTITTPSALVLFATAYNDQSDETPTDETPVADELVIPEDLASLSADDLAALDTRAREAFAALWQDGQNPDLTSGDVETMQTLTEGIEAIATEQTARTAAAAELAEEAAAMAARIAPVEASEDAPESGDEDGEGAEGNEPVEGEAVVVAEVAEPIAASARRPELRVNLASLRGRQTGQRPAAQSGNGERSRMSDIVFAAPNLVGFAEGQGMDWNAIGTAVDRQLASFPAKQYENAARQGKHLRQQFGLVTITKPFDASLRITSDDPVHVEQVLTHAVDESRLPGGSLVASGTGWCAPSTTIYDLCEMETRDGLFDLPEVAITRGGLRSSMGPSFSTLFNQIGFSYTEQDDIDGNFDGNGGGSKPCYQVECPDFNDDRLNLDGLCITADLLQRRGYPEAIARTTRGALVAHDHHISANILAAIENASTAVSMAGSQVGALAPLLTAIELQGEHYREVRRLSRTMSLEAVFPFWVRGAIRADLSRRTGVDLIDVPDARIDAWFRQRGIAPQFVYNFHGLGAPGSAPSGITSYPSDVTFLLYAAGTWVRGGSDVVTLDTVYDSTLLGTNDYTALFSEEGWLVAQRCEDSRAITVDLCPDGSTAIAVAIDCDGSAGS